MESKPLGRTGVTIPEIGLGTSRYRGGIEPLRKGISLGGFIDTAEMYGTEDVVGSAVQGTRDSAFIASKVLPRNLKYSDLMQALERSLKLLQTDYIDLYQLHYPNPSVPNSRKHEGHGRTSGSGEDPVYRGQQFLDN